MALALPGFGLSLFWFVSFVGAWITRRVFPWEGGPHLVWGIVGVLLYLVGWLWGLLTGLGVWRQTKS